MLELIAICSFIWCILVLLALLCIDSRSQYQKKATAQILLALTDIAARLEVIGRSLDPDGARHQASLQHDQAAAAARIAQEQQQLQQQQEQKQARKQQRREAKNLKRLEADVTCPSCGAKPTIRDLRPDTRHDCPSCGNPFQSSEVLDYG